MDREWDTVVILDACRYDTFLDVLPEAWPRPDRIKSRAGDTWEFYGENFRQAPYPDTVLVTANPRAVRRQGGSFHDVIPVYEDDWDDDAGTVPPDVMAERTIEAHDRYPNKRIFSHWIQPHYPFIGSERIEGHKFDDDGSIWNDVKRGGISVEEVYQAYRDTLEMTIPHVRRVLDAIDGRVAVTSDHGNGFGERPWWFPVSIYGHPRGVRHPSIVDVPWLVFEGEHRRTITGGEISDISASDRVDDRLRALGYKG